MRTQVGYYILEYLQLYLLCKTPSICISLVNIQSLAQFIPRTVISVCVLYCSH